MSLCADLVQGVPHQVSQAVLVSGVLTPNPVDPEVVAAAFKMAPQQVKVTTVSSGPSTKKKPAKGKKARLAKAKHATAQIQAQEAPKMFSMEASGAPPFQSGAGGRGSRGKKTSGFASTKRGKYQ